MTEARAQRPSTTPSASVPVGVGIVGSGDISGTYLRTLAGFPQLRVVAVADLVPERAENRAREFGIARASSPDELLADPEVSLVVNLTIPAAHGEVARAAIEAGRSVYSEKPLSIDLDEGRRLVALARERDLRIGAAPDTWLGTSIQQARRVIDSGAIGEPTGVLAAVAHPGPESWHPNPAFFYRRGAGPLFDIGPYYVTTLVFLLGPVRRVSSSARITHPERPVTGGPMKGDVLTVETPTHVSAVLDFAAGPVGTLITSWDVVATEMPHIEVHGTEGTLSLPDPNTFQGPLRIRRHDSRTWEELPPQTTGPHGDRGIGFGELVDAMVAGRPHRNSGELALHTLEVMSSILQASDQGRAIDLTTTVERPEPLPEGWLRDAWRAQPVPA